MSDSALRALEIGAVSFAMLTFLIAAFLAVHLGRRL